MDHFAECEMQRESLAVFSLTVIEFESEIEIEEGARVCIRDQNQNGRTQHGVASVR
jgi:hypothetical protein